MGQTQEQCSDFGWGDVLHPDDAERTVAAWKECVRTGGNWDIEHRYRGVDGSWHPVLARGVPVRNSRGEIVFWAGINLDISSLKQAQEALESARREAVNEKNRLEAVMEALPVGMAITDARGGTIRSNRMFEQIWGGPRPRTDNVGDYAAYKAWWADTGRAVQPEEWASSQAVREGKTVVGQMMELEGFDGSRRFVLNSAAPILDAGGNRIGSAVAIQDVTELHRIEQALKESEERLRLGQACAQVGVWDYHPRTGIIDTTPEFDQLYGLTEGPRLTYEDWTWRIHPEDLPKIKEVRNRAIIDHQTFDLEFRILHPSRGERWISSKGGALYDTSGEVTRIFGVNADITERKLSEEALRNSEERYRGLYEAVAGGVVMQDQDGKIVEANATACEMLGLSPDEIRGRSSTDPRWHSIREDGSSFPGEEHPSIVTLRTGRPIRGIVMGVFHPAEEGYRWLMVNSEPIFEPGTDRGRWVVTTSTDITQRKLIESALRESEERYRSLVELSPDAVVVHQDGQFVYANPAALRLYGAEAPEQFIGHPVLELIHADDRDLVAGRMETVHVQGISPRREMRLLRLDGQAVPVESTAFSMQFQGRPAVTAIIRDISERKRMEAERLELERLKMLCDSRKLWQDTFDSITDPISIHDPDGSLRRANRAFLEYFGLSMEAAVGKKWEDICHPDGLPAGSHPLAQSLATAAPASGEYTDAARSRNFEIFVFPLASDVEGFPGCIQIAKDITDKRESEIRLIVSERLAAVGQLAAGVAHEINNPLATISGCAEGLLSRIDKAYDPKETREYLRIVKEEVLRCKSITDGMLAFVRHTSYEVRPVSVNETLDRDIEMMRLQGRLHNVQVKREYSPDLPQIMVREGDLRQVFLALLANALDAMDERGVLTVRTGLEAGHVFAIIKDAGPGVDPEHRDRIFDLFFTTKAQKGGTGIGLPVARKLIRSMSGQINLEPGPGSGASFRVSIPV